MTRTVFRNGLVFDGVSADAAAADVLVENGRIVEVGTGLDGDVAVECAGKSIVPGLFDCHVHVTVTDLDFVKAGRMGFSLHFFEAARNLKRLLDSGITYARDAAGADLGIKQALQQGLIPGPRLQISIAMISQTGGHFDRCLPCGDVQPMPAMMPHPGRPASIADGVDDIRRKARQMLVAGADVFKTASSGGVMSPGDDPHHAHYRMDELEALVAEAEAAHTYVMAHAQSTLGIKNAVRAGVRSIEHGFYLDDEGIELMLERGAWLVPTLSAAHGIIAAASRGLVPEDSLRQMQEGVEAQKEAFRKAVAAGVKIAMGSDAPGLPFGESLFELQLMAEASDMTALDAYRAASSSSAELMQVDGEFGSLQPGKVADLVVIDGDLADLTELRTRVEQVWQSGVQVR